LEDIKFENGDNGLVVENSKVDLINSFISNIRGVEVGSAFKCISGTVHFENVRLLNNSGEIPAFCQVGCKFTQHNTFFL